MKKQSGFTLIELVIVIIILGILAVTAAPKFLDMQDDARNATLKGMEGALNSAGALVYSKAVLAGQEEAAGPVDLPLGGSSSVSIAYGYPVATSAALSDAAEFNEADWDFDTPAGDSIKIYPKGVLASDPSECFVQYTEAADENTPPVVTTTVCN